MGVGNLEVNSLRRKPGTAPQIVRFPSTASAHMCSQLRNLVE